MFRILIIFVVIAFPTQLWAQSLGVGSNFSTQSYSGSLTGQGKAPINLSGILSGNSTTSSGTSSYAYNPSVNVTTNNGAATSGVPYSFSMNPLDAARNRAQRDSIAQKNQLDTLAYLNNDAITQSYTDEYNAMQQQLGLPGATGTTLIGNIPFGSGLTQAENKPVMTRNTKVRYKKKKSNKLKKPRRVFSSNY